MAERVVVAGAGMVPFRAPGSNASGMAERAIRNALDDAGIDVELVDQAVASHVHGNPTAGDRVFARAGLTGIAVSSVSNGCASGSAALFHARQALLSGDAQCVIAVGFRRYHRTGCAAPRPRAALRRAARLARAANGVCDETFARVAVKARAWRTQSVRRPPRPAFAGRSARRADSSRPSSPLVCERRKLWRRSGRSLRRRASRAHGLRDDVLIARMRSRATTRRRGEPLGRCARQQHHAARRGTGLRKRRRRSGRHRRRRSPRLLCRRRIHLVRGARTLRRRRHRPIRAIRGEHVWRQGRRFAVRRIAFAGSCVGRHRARAGLRAHLAAARRSRLATGCRRTRRAAAQRRARRHDRGRHPPPQGLAGGRSRSFRAIIESGQVTPLAVPARSPNLNAYAERWVRSVKEEVSVDSVR